MTHNIIDHLIYAQALAAATKPYTGVGANVVHEMQELLRETLTKRDDAALTHLQKTLLEQVAQFRQPLEALEELFEAIEDLDANEWHTDHQ